MATPNEVITVAHAVQQSVAPVFLITGVGSLLSVLSARLARVIDRFRTLDKFQDNMNAEIKLEMSTLIRRSRWIHWAITLCTTSALLICIVIAALFIGSELNKDPSGTISIFFTTAMLTLTAGLVCFLREISLSIGVIKLRQ